LPSSHYDNSACALGNDIYVFGGIGLDEEDHASVFKYETMTNAWSTLAPMPFNGPGLSSSVLGEMIYIVGGASRDLRRFEPVSGTWSVLAPMSKVRHFSTSFVLNGSLFVAGGVGNRGSVERYDVATDTWTDMADMLEGRKFFGAATIQPAGPADGQSLFDALITQATHHHAS
jgi:N-acetylneuraminic acid mutarotase